MFSAVLNAQNKVTNNNSINSVTWNISSDTPSEYTGSQQTVDLVSVDPPFATYYVDTIGATNVGETAYSVLYGTNSYSGIFTSYLLTITPAQLTGTPQDVSSYYTGQPLTGSVAININGTYTRDGGITIETGDATITETNIATYGPDTLTGTGNYTGTLTTGTFTISPGYFTVIIEQGQIDPPTSSYAIKAKCSGGPTSATLNTYDNNTGSLVESFIINDTNWSEGMIFYANFNQYDYVASAGGYNVSTGSFNFP